MLAKIFANNIFRDLEAQVATEEGGSRLARCVAILLLAVVAALLWTGVLLAWSAEVDTDVASVQLRLVLRLEGLRGILGVDELNVSESLASARVAVRDDADASELSKLLELTREPLFIDTPAKIADEEVGNSAGGVRLGLLGGLFWLAIGLALLALGLSRWLLLFLFVTVAVARVVGALLKMSVGSDANSNGLVLPRRRQPLELLHQPLNHRRWSRQMSRPFLLSRPCR